MATLYRPVGLHELALIWDLEFHGFPPRLPHQPIFYPVTTIDYARQIARDWNVTDEASGFAGYVTRFDISDEYLGRFEPHVVGSAMHSEYWIPAVQLSEFNAAIIDTVTVVEAFFGSNFVGCVPEKYGLQGRSALDQFATLARTWDYSRMDFSYELWANRKAFYLNSWFWAQQDFAAFSIDSEKRQAILDRLVDEWEHHRIQPNIRAAFAGNG